MPDLGNLSLSASLPTLARSPARLKPPADSPAVDSLRALSLEDRGTGRSLHSPTPRPSGGGDGSGIRVFRRRRPGANQQRTAKKPSGAKSLEDYLRDWADKKKESGAPESRFSLPFLVRAKKMADCLFCRLFIYPGEEVLCSVRACRGVYHIKCVKEGLGINPKNFKCPQHSCFLCKQKTNWRCVRCPIASHNKCAPWPDEVIELKNQPNHAICWRHPTDWRLDGKNDDPTSNIEEIFSLLPLPYTPEEFKIDFTWKDTQNIEPPPYVHIKRNIYLIKKKCDDADDGTGCTSCSTECSQNCMCRVQCISCSKACRCSENCKNRPFRKEKKIKIVKTELCGWGVVAAEAIDKGDFIVEYIGEVIDDALCEKRLWDMKHKNVHNFYMCEIRKDFTIDATYKGNTSRFLNHGCDPNCVLEKWEADGETRVGVFAARSINIGEPLTYDYRFVQFGPEVACHCGASNCQGYLGTKKKIDKTEMKEMKLCTKKKTDEVEMKGTKLRWGSKRKRSATACTAVVTV